MSINPNNVTVIQYGMERETGRKAQLSNIDAAKTVSDIIRTCLGPRAMLKMLLDPMGGIVLTNDGNAILREVEVCAIISLLKGCPSSSKIHD
jgi:T-complex protein 1 subunit gamma